MTFNFQLKKYGSGNETKEKEEGECCVRRQPPSFPFDTELLRT